MPKRGLVSSVDSPLITTLQDGRNCDSSFAHFSDDTTVDADISVDGGIVEEDQTSETY